MMKTITVRGVAATVTCFALVCAVPIAISYAKTEKQINASVQTAMDRFKKQVQGAETYLKAAKGVLVIPQIEKVGLVLGEEYGQGGFMLDGKSVAYYGVAAGSVGLQLGAEKFDLVIMFMTDEALKTFRESKGWTAGTDAAITLVQKGAAVDTGTLISQSPVLGFVFGQRGLIAGMSVNGSKFTKITPEQ